MPPSSDETAAEERGADEAIVRMVDELLAPNSEADRLFEQSEQAHREGRHAQGRAFRDQADVLVREKLDLRARLAATQATTPRGLHAKARAVRAHGDCVNGGVTGYGDADLAWSLANDILGLPTEFKKSEEWELTNASPATVAAKPVPWCRTPRDAEAFMAQARADFTRLGQCEALLNRADEALENAWRERPAKQAQLYEQLFDMTGRYERDYFALRAALMRLSDARRAATAVGLH